MTTTSKSLGRSRDVTQPLDKLHPNETIKAESNLLRGTIAQGLEDPITGGISADDQQLLKFHGSYQQDDRDLRDERRRQKLEPAYQFMARVRLAGGVCQPWQWLKLDELACRYGNGTLRLTTRQTFQFHGVIKKDMKRTIQGLDAALLDTIAACGDVNRGVMCATNPDFSAVHGTVYELAKQVSDHLLPKTRAYHEIWLDEKPVAGSPAEEEPIYGRTYLPRKFKIAFAVPPSNDVDVYAHDLGFIAIREGDDLAGFNVTVGGGMGRTDNEPNTYPRLADVIGFCRPEQVVEVAEQIVGIQRDFGDRADRKRARFKYTIDERGLDWFKAELTQRLGWSLDEARPFRFDTNGDRYGWTEGLGGASHYTLFIENGRVQDVDGILLMTGLREIARVHAGEFRLTPNQNLIIANVAADKRPDIEALLKTHGLDGTQSVLRRAAIACVALPTCGLAMAESERYLPHLITRFEEIVAECGLEDEPITIRMSGCPNGCSRPYVAEIAFTGRAPGKYNVYLGGGFHGQRLNTLFRENIGEETIIEELGPIIRRYAAERTAGERFGDFVMRAGYLD
ncbi:assimilatory sulfite reductase (NADPH) hemoprotein subunit [Rhodospirillaceae bacterium SYSU D60014]|uniref:assimilatory sulfite reductase (NADPH) hemoprotein subunit n=1 Tax=Virgifigura deserti TaxID=2268457 RepID=UPI000E67311A